jgi:hypothetical protein
MPRSIVGSSSDAPDGKAWLEDLAQQLDSVIDEDPRKRSAGTLIIRALIRQALKGDVRAIRECLNLAQRHQTPPAAEPVQAGRGRRATKVDLAEVRRLARKGMRSLSTIARCLNLPKQTLLGAKHGAAAKEAFETGRALFELDALEEYATDIANNRRNPLVIFKLKQLGWTDKLEAVAPGANVLESALANKTNEELADILAVTLKRLQETPEATAAPETGRVH